MMQKRISLALAFCTLLSACSGTGFGEAADPEGPKESQTTTTAPPTPTAETDFDALYRELSAQRSEALAEVDPEKLAEVSDVKQALAEIQRAADAGETRVESLNYRYAIDDVELFQVVNEDLVTLQVDDTFVGSLDRLDADGNEVGKITRQGGSLSETFFVVLVRDGGDDWKIQFVEQTDTFPETADEFVEQTTFELGSQTISFRIATLNGDECFALVGESGLVMPWCISKGSLKNASFTRYTLDYDEQFEAVVSATGDTGLGLYAEVDGTRLDFVAFGDSLAYGVTVAEVGVIQEVSFGGDGGDGPGSLDVPTLRETFLQRRAGTFVPDETDEES